MPHTRTPAQVATAGLLAIALSMLPGVAAPAATLETGSTVPQIHFTDQFDASRALAECSRLILFAPDRDSASLATAVLTETDASLLEGRQVCYVADISGMPSLVTRMFALPAMRDYGFPVMLGREAASTGDFPRRAGMVTVIRVNAGSVDGLEYAGDVDTIRQALDRVASP